ncbi:hypothetical protein M9H77_10742 [Catharanthus roseus]|uniref:Uncharacterized protein n=1 Tax=Catharanthus roseus TaxID=4058 RepID=A0ACC0BCM7_CATRO|nr:hypothetical protein M9H77_10742 [Catharanthus roseus]
MENVKTMIPRGYKYKFEPSDEDILYYLRCKINGEALPCENAIREIDLYRVSDPGTLFEGISKEEKSVYIFNKLKKVTENGKRVDRTVLGNRTWKGVDGGRPIFDTQLGGVCKVGEKKNFVFVNKMKTKLGYNMTEFSLGNSTIKDHYVICQIKKQKDKKPRTRSSLPPESPSVVSTSEQDETTVIDQETSKFMPLILQGFNGEKGSESSAAAAEEFWSYQTQQQLQETTDFGWSFSACNTGTLESFQVMQIKKRLLGKQDNAPQDSESSLVSASRVGNSPIVTVFPCDLTVLSFERVFQIIQQLLLIYLRRIGSLFFGHLIRFGEPF